jgi:tetratricopeptide (TPR) repeat protein
MSSDEWFRNVDWDDLIAARFEEKLKRARRKEQYLRIQASTLASRKPEVALKLLDRYFELPDDFDHAQAHVDRAIAYLTMGQLENALKSYEAALAREEVFPRLLTGAWLDLPFLIAVQGVAARFDQALTLLDRFKARLMFPVDQFKWHAAKSIILYSRGDKRGAKVQASAALEAASRSASDFSHHSKVGLVGARYEDIRGRMESYSDA